MESLVDIFSEEIHLFFKDKLPMVQIDERGKVRIVKHDFIQTLQVEPVEGGQYELAVRIPFSDGYPKSKYYKQNEYRGYAATEDGFLHGFNMCKH